jgi:hypothetical protein
MGHGVVPGRKGDPLDLDVPSGEAVRVALPAVDEDREAFRDGPGTRDPGSGVRCPGRLLGLPEDGRASACLGEDELRASKAGSVEHQVDNRTATAYEGNASLLYDLGDIGPVGLVRMTVDPGRARPGVTGLEHQTTLNRQAQQVGQLAVFLGVAGDQEDGPCHRLKPPGIR